MTADAPKLPPLYTGRSRFLEANRHLGQSIWLASQHCRIESSEDIHDAQGIMLWARHQPVEPELLAKLADRELRKPIELCVVAQEPVTAEMLEAELDALCARAPDFEAVLGARQPALRQLLRALPLNAQELLLISVLRFGGRDRLSHAVAVTAVALAAALAAAPGETAPQPLARAALLHDVGLLYLPEETRVATPEQVHHRHALLGALAAVELAQRGPEVGEMISHSHERLDGSGFPAGLKADKLPWASRVLQFAEAVADALADPAQGVMRALMISRVAPQEFDPRLVGWLASAAHACKGQGSEQGALARANGIGLRLRQMHADLSRAVVLLTLPVGEVLDVRQAAKAWLPRMMPLMHALSASGVEEALSQGLHIEPESDAEAAELLALHAELAARIQAFARSLALDRARLPLLARSRLVQDLARLLNEAAPAPSSSLPISIA
jgi:HD-GYP domain-containing protein (c-di-GMP phosphodiesterase class II)